VQAVPEQAASSGREWHFGETADPENPGSAVICSDSLEPQELVAERPSGFSNPRLRTNP